MKNFYSIFMVLIIVVFIMFTMTIVGTEAILKNSDLTNDSLPKINTFNSQLVQSYNESNFALSSTNLTNNTNFDSEDVFAQSYLESKTESQSFIGVVRSIWAIPDLFILGLGIPLSSVNIFKGIVLTFIGVMISFATFKAIFGGGRIDES